MKKVIIYTLIIAASLVLFISNGYCVGAIQHPFVPAETYPNQSQFDQRLANLPFDFEIVAGGLEKAVIIVDMDDPFYLQKGNQIHDAIMLLNPSFDVPVIDDEAPINWGLNIILVGNYATNKVIDEWVYKNFHQFVDINRPGSSRYVINNVRIGTGANYTTAVVVGSQSTNMISSGVTKLIEFINASYNPTTTSIVLGSTVNYGNYWYPPDTSPEPSTTTSNNIGNAISDGNVYWLTGDTGYAALFYNKLHNYGVLAEDPNNFPPNGNFNNVVGDNSGALDFHLFSLVNTWKNLERSPYFATRPAERLYITRLLNWMLKEYYQCSNTGAAFGYAGDDGYPLGNHELSAARGYANGGKYFSEEGWNFNQTAQGACPPGYPNDYAGGWIQDSDDAFAVYLTLGYPNDDAVGYFMSDPSFTREYCWIKHNQAISQDYFDDDGGPWNTGVDRGVADFFCMLAPNKCINTIKTAGFGDTHGFAPPDYQPYDLRFWAEQYRDSDGGKYAWMCGSDMFNAGTLNSIDKWGKSWLQFGLRTVTPIPQPADYLGIKVMALEEQMRRYLNSFDDGRESYGQSVYDDPLYEVNLRTDIPEPDYIANKVALRSGYNATDQYMALDCAAIVGHGHDDALAITNYQVNNRCFLADHAYGNRNFTYGTSGDPLDPDHINWSWYNIDFKAREYHNALSVKKTDEPASEQKAKENSSGAAALRNTGDFSKTGFVDLELPEYGNFTEWNGWSITPPNDEWRTTLKRTLFWKKKTPAHQGYFLVLDEVKLHDTVSAGNYEIALNWRSLHDGTDLAPFQGEGTNKITINQTGEHCVIHTLNNEYNISYDSIHTPIPEGEPWPSNYPANAGFFDDSINQTTENLNTPWEGNLTGTLSRIYATVSDTLNTVNDRITLTSLIYAYSGTTDPNYSVTQELTNETIYHIISSVNNENVYLGKALNSQEKNFAGYSVMANLFHIEPGTTVPNYIVLVNAYKLAQGTQLVFDSSDGGTTYLSASIEFDFNTKTGIIEVNEAGGSVIRLYADQFYQVQRYENGNWVNVPTTYADSLVTFDAAEGKYEYKYANGTPAEPSLSIDNVSLSEGNSGTVTAQFTVSLSQASSEEARVDFTTADNTATIADNDYEAISGTLIFAPNDITKTINVIVNGDINLEADETFLVNLTNPLNATIADGSGEGTILNDDSSTPSGNNVALGKSYQCTPPNSSYPDSGGELTDGLYAPPSSRRVGWSGGWGGVLWNFWVKIDLGQPTSINTILISAFGGDAPGWGGMIFPDSMDVYTALEDNPNAYTLVTTIVNGLGNPGVMQTQIFEGNFNANARYVKVVFNCSPAQGGGSGFVLLDEIEILAPEIQPNQPPVIAPIAPTMVTAGQTARVNVSATDPNNDPITLSIDETLPAKASFIDYGNGTGRFILQTGNAMAGNTYTFTLRASDGVDSSTAPIVITVTSIYGPTGPNRNAK